MKWRWAFECIFFKEPRIVEAATLAGLDLSSLNGASDVWQIEKIHMLDVAVFSAERHIVEVLRQQGMQPEFFAIPGGDLDSVGMHFIELGTEGMLSLRMASIRVAADVGMNLNVPAMTLDFALQPGCKQRTRCSDEDSVMC